MNVCGFDDATKDFKESPLITLGKMIASDLIMNNPDRLPAIWPNGGNEGNIMCQILMDQELFGKEFLLNNPRNLQKMNMINLVGIDSKSYMIKIQNNKNNMYFKEYAGKVKEFLKNVFNDVAIFRSST